MRKFFIVFVLIISMPSFAQEEISEARQKSRLAKLNAIAESVRNDVREYDAIAKAVDERNCKTFLKLKGITKENILTKRHLLAAELISRGICFKQDYTQVANHLKKEVQIIHNSSYALAKLGNLYWLGLGVEKDQAKARDYFKLSVLHLGTKLLHTSEFEALKPVVKSYWGFTNKEKDWTYSTYEFGSWRLPPPLIEELNWLKNLKDAPNTGEQVWNISQNLRYGTNGMPGHTELAAIWALSSATEFNHSPIQIQAAKLFFDPKFKAEILKQFSNSFFAKKNVYLAHSILWQAVQNDNLSAFQYAYCTIRQQEDEPINYTNLYLAGVFLKNNNIPLDEAIFANISSKVDPDIQNYAQDWINEGIAKRIGVYLLSAKKYCDLK